VQARARGTVESILWERRGAQGVRVRVGDALRQAVAYPALTGAVAVGSSVLLNTWAVEMGLGTGGLDFVMAVEDGETVAEPPGHIMKLRYTPLQHPVIAAAAPESPHHDAIAGFSSLEGLPVVCAELHSQIAAIAAAAKWESHGKARVVYVMTDGAALPLALSNLVAELCEKRLLDATITAGQAFGGDYEAVNLYSALAAARVVANADVVIVSQGPGNTGTDTQLGFSGVDQGLAVNAAGSLDGTPIVAARISFADARERHLGMSHHTRTILSRIALVPAMVPLPRLPLEQRASLRASMIADGEKMTRHDFITVDAEAGLRALIESGVNVTTMGRGIEEERAFFLAAAAAGLLAGQCVTGSSEGQQEL
jgi:hypothetical protein